MLDQLKDQRTQLAIQRSQAKDVVEMCERRMETIGAMISLLEEQAKNANAPDSE